MNTREPGQTRDGDHGSFGIKIQNYAERAVVHAPAHCRNGGVHSKRTAKFLESFEEFAMTLRYDGEATVQSGPIRVAIVGTGGIARVHAAALQAGPATAAPGAASGGSGPAAGVLCAAADVDAERLAAFADEHGVAAAYGDLDELLRDARPDLVHICTPPHAHYEQALKCLQSGVSVLVEKPPVISLREFDLLAAAEGGAGPWFASVYQHRFGGAQRRLKALVSGGALGRPLLAVCHTTWFRDQGYFDVPWRGRWDTEGGGPTMGHGIHQMDMLLDVLGDWTEVRAIARRQARRIRTEDVSLAHVTFASGAVASVVNSVLSPREESYLRFDFERATVEVTHLYGYTDQSWRITPAPGWQVPPPAGGPGAASGHREQFAEVLACLAAGRRPPVAPAESRRTLSLVAGIYAAAFTGQPVTPADLGHSSPFYDRMDGGQVPW
jgi:predicted dehydrogenase